MKCDIKYFNSLLFLFTSFTIKKNKFTFLQFFMSENKQKSTKWAELLFLSTFIFKHLY